MVQTEIENALAKTFSRAKESSKFAYLGEFLLDKVFL